VLSFAWPFVILSLVFISNALFRTFSMQLWHTATGRLERVLPVQHGRVWDLAATRDGRGLVSATADGRVTVRYCRCAATTAAAVHVCTRMCMLLMSVPRRLQWWAVDDATGTGQRLLQAEGDVYSARLHPQQHHVVAGTLKLTGYMPENSGAPGPSSLKASVTRWDVQAGTTRWRGCSM
jgi:hypothetical protein